MYVGVFFGFKRELRRKYDVWFHMVKQLTDTFKPTHSIHKYLNFEFSLLEAISRHQLTCFTARLGFEASYEAALFVITFLLACITS